MSIKIYVITHIASSKQYVGQTIRPLKRRLQTLFANRPRKSLITESLREFGQSAFSIEEVDRTDNQKHADLLEREWINKLNTMHPNGFNLQSGGRAGSSYHEIAKQKIKKAWETRDPASDETRNKMSISQKKAMASNKSLREKRISYLISENGKGICSKRILCTTENRMFDSAIDAAKEYNLSVGRVCAVARGEQKTTGRFAKKKYSFVWADTPGGQ